MDIQFLRTFLEVARVRHFGKAAENLFLTQSAVSARIRMLEESIGEPLFIRQRNNIQLSPTGEKLLPFAEGIVNLWNRAKQEVCLADQSENVISISSTPGLWELFLHYWLSEVVQSHYPVSVVTSAYSNAELFQQLNDYSLDLAFTLDPQSVKDLLIKQVATIPVILVSTKKNQSIQEALSEQFIFVDWGTSINTQISNHFAEFSQPIYRIDQNHLALSILLKHQGAAYLAEQTIREHIAKKKLYVVPNAPVFERILFAVYSPNSHHADLVGNLLKLFQKMADLTNPDLGQYTITS